MIEFFNIAPLPKSQMVVPLLVTYYVRYEYMWIIPLATSKPESIKYDYFYLGRRVYQFNENGVRTRMFWIRGGRTSMPEAPRAALAVSAEEIYIFGVSVH